MATSGRPDAESPAASDVAARIRSADFVRVVSGATAEALAATGTLLDGLATAGLGHQTAVAPYPDTASRATDADLTVAIGRPDLLEPASDEDTGDGSDEGTTIDLGADADDALGRRAYAVARTLGGNPDPVLALAGTVAGGREPTGAVLEDATAAGVERRPGLAIPVANPVDGLVHSTVLHGPFSADEDAAREAITAADYPVEGDPTEDDRRRLASQVALAVTGDPAASDEAARAIEDGLRPYAGGPFGTVDGYADVLSALATVDPGLGLCLVARSNDAPANTIEAALDRWRSHGRAAHAAVRGAEVDRRDGLLVAGVRDDAPLPAVGRLLVAYRSPEPVVLVVTDGAAAAVTRADEPATHLGRAIAEAATAADGTGGGTAGRARATFDDRETFLAAVREAV